MSKRLGTGPLAQSVPKVRTRSLLKPTALSHCGALLISACTSGNKVTPSYDAGLNDSEFEALDTEPLDTEASSMAGDAGADAGVDAGADSR